MNNIAIKLTNVCKNFNLSIDKNSTIYGKLSSQSKKSHVEKIQVLNDVSFEIKKGELLGIIGKNGQGKSTLLRIISRIYRQDSGDVFVDGKIALFLDLGTGFQLDMTARENIILLGMIMGFSREEISKKIPEIVQFAELEKFLDTKLRHFSTGMYARLGFSTAIAMESDIFLIDEILSVGDKEFQKKSFETFMKLRSQGKTFLVVSHNHETLKTISDRMILLHNGKIASIGEPDKVIQDYDRFT